MAVEGCGKIVQFLMFIFNFIVLVAGIAVLAVGIWIIVDKNEFQELIGTHLYATGAYVLIASGAFVTILSFFGCLGAVKEIRCLLLTFFVFLFVIFIIMLAGGIVGYVFKGQLEDSLKMTMKNTLVDQYGIKVNGTGGSVDIKNQAVTDAWDLVQRNFDCCAVGNSTTPKNFKLYEESAWIKAGTKPENKQIPPRDKAQVPKSCCKIDETSSAWCDMKDFNPPGCYDAANDFLYSKALIVGGIGVGVACVLIFGMIFSICLYRQID